MLYMLCLERSSRFYSLWSIHLSCDRLILTNLLTFDLLLGLIQFFLTLSLALYVVFFPLFVHYNGEMWNKLNLPWIYGHDHDSSSYITFVRFTGAFLPLFAFFSRLNNESKTKTYRQKVTFKRDRLIKHSMCNVVWYVWMNERTGDDLIFLFWLVDRSIVRWNHRKLWNKFYYVIVEKLNANSNNQSAHGFCVWWCLIKSIVISFWKAFALQSIEWVNEWMSEWVYYLFV